MYSSLELNLNCYRSAGWRCGSDHGVRLQIDERISGHGHWVRPRQNGHSAGMGILPPADVDCGPTEDAEFVAGQSATGSRPGYGRRSGGRHGGHAGGRGRVAGAKGPTSCGRCSGHQTNSAVSHRRTRPTNGHARGTQHICTALGRTRQPGSHRATPQTFNRFKQSRVQLVQDIKLYNMWKKI